MKIALLASFPLSTVPGFADLPRPRVHHSTWLPPLAEAWADADGIELRWIVLSDEVAERREARAWNQTFVALPSARSGRASTLFRDDRLAIGWELAAFGPDLVHAWGTEDAYALAAARSGFPYLVSMQGILSHYALHAAMDARTYWQAVLELFLLRKAPTITCESAWAAGILRRRASRARIERIEYGVHPDFHRASWNPDPARPAALFAGTLTPRKGVPDLLAAFRTPALAGKELWIAGAGPREEAYRREAPPNVRWLGHLDRAGLIDALSRAWCLALPSRADTSPNVVKEARVLGLPVVTTPCGGQADYVREGENGFLAAPGDVPRLAAALDRLLSSLDFCRARGRDGWEADRALFTPRLTADRFRALYRELAP